MAGEALDIRGYLVLNPGSAVAAPAEECYIPLLRGSRMVTDPALQKEMIAVGQIEEVAYTQGVKIPALQAVAPLYSNWFTAARLGPALIPTAEGGTFPGLINIASPVTGKGFGAAQWKYANKTAEEYSKSKLARLELAWGRDRPVIASMLILGYGAKEATPTALASSPATSPPIGPYFMSQATEYNGVSGLTGIEGGRLAFDLRMMPDVTTPMTTAPDATTGVTFANEFWNDGPPQVTLSLDIKKTSGTPPDAAEGTNNALSVILQNMAKDAGIQFDVDGMKPVREEEIQGRVAIIRYTYQNFRDTAATMSYALTQVT